MNITNLVLALYLILAGLDYLDLFAVSGVLLGVLALIAGILLLASGVGANTTWSRR